MGKTSTNSAKRTRNYACVVYPESAPENWLELLRDHNIPAFVSPLHNKDVNPDGTVKKEHYHVQFLNDGPKTPEQMKTVFETFGGVGCEVVNSARGYARYLCHLDNPEKAQYCTEAVVCIAGADYIATINLASDKYRAIREMMNFCLDNEVYAYSDLLLYCSIEREDWFRVLCDNGTMVMKEFLKSQSWKMKEQKMKDEQDMLASIGEMLKKKND